MDIKLESKLHSEWPSLKKGEKDEVFWEREWNKHGTCSPNNFTQNQYLELTLEIKNGLNLLAILAKSGVVPDNSKKYLQKQILDAVKSVTMKEPGLMCSPRTTLQEIRICLESDGKHYKDCSQTIQPKNNCDQKVTFPL